MRNNIAIPMLLFVMLFGPTECRQLVDAASNSSSIAATTTINSTTSLDETKLTFIGCPKGQCDYFDPNWSTCYCCPHNGRREYCHLTREECRANCALCRPKC
ncbi:hypothetical protein BDA96_03G010600 [Sorghum bicolor]|uniref:Embryo surrounding factor 1 brassicaceae domain-containing protein n=2 Tax=Sorghum bicolor TaxID=4558 RepID=A0A921R9V5_SORBI|nr:hypothetical protein BDA96_03G010600 [Sorghum bicolor]OQU86076.1 hypothetical protein SORBI_3003G009650 [Sorghum bicolor]